MATVRVRRERIETAQGARDALVAEPGEHLVLGRALLDALRAIEEPAVAEPSAIDRALLEAAAEARGAHLMVFRGKNDHETGSYAFDEALDETERMDLAYRLLRSQLPTYRKLVAAGIIVLFHVDLGFAEVEAFRSQIRRLADELKRDEGSVDPTLRDLDVWILDHLAYFFAVSYQRVLEETLPSMLPLIERRATQVAERLAALPPGTL
jgi:hypothetical protein